MKLGLFLTSFRLKYKMNFGKRINYPNIFLALNLF